MVRTVICSVLIFLTGASAGGWAQTAASAARADGRATPLLVYEAVNAGAGCAPLALISHGAGGTEQGYGYLAQAMAGMGYTTVVMGHRESGPSALREAIRSNGLRKGVWALVASQKAETDRLLDVDAALKWADARCRPPFKVLLGHSMGAVTVMLEAGAKNMIGVASPPAGRDRFDAYVALSPEGPGVVFPDDAWANLRKPMLVLTGTEDRALNGGYETRLTPWKEMPGAKGRCQWLGVIDRATHMNFAGSGLGAEKVDAEVTSTIASFLDGVRGGDCRLHATQGGMTLQAK